MFDSILPHSPTFIWSLCRLWEHRPQVPDLVNSSPLPHPPNWFLNPLKGTLLQPVLKSFIIVFIQYNEGLENKLTTVIPINYVWMAKLWNVLSGKKIDLGAWSNPEALVFKVLRGIFDIAICCFAWFSFLVFLLKFTDFEKRNSLTQFFEVWYLGSLLTKFRGDL